MHGAFDVNKDSHPKILSIISNQQAPHVWGRYGDSFVKIPYQLSLEPELSKGR